MSYEPKAILSLTFEEINLILGPGERMGYTNGQQPSELVRKLQRARDGLLLSAQKNVPALVEE